MARASSSFLRASRVDCARLFIFAVRYRRRAVCFARRTEGRKNEKGTRTLGTTQRCHTEFLRGRATGHRDTVFAIVYSLSAAFGGYTERKNSIANNPKSWNCLFCGSKFYFFSGKGCTAPCRVPRRVFSAEEGACFWLLLLCGRLKAWAEKAGPSPKTIPHLGRCFPPSVCPVTGLAPAFRRQWGRARVVLDLRLRMIAPVFTDRLIGGGNHSLERNT